MTSRWFLYRLLKNEFVWTQKVRKELTSALLSELILLTTTRHIYYSILISQDVYLRYANNFIAPFDWGWALLRPHNVYTIHSTARIDKKLCQQSVNPFGVIERVGQVVYPLAIPDNWCIHPVFTIARVEPCPSPSNDAFERIRRTTPDSVFVEGDSDKVKSWEVERLVDKRVVARGVEYLVRWKGWDEEHDFWRSLPELENAMHLIKKYDTTERTLPARQRTWYCC